MQTKKAIVAVTNDLTTDQRVDRTCHTLVASGYEVMLVGRKLKTSLPLTPRSYSMHRMRLLFNKGPLFYAAYNIRLFLYLITHRSDLIVSNDLDTLLASHLANKIKRSSSSVDHLHDCHEYFRGVPELIGRKRTIRIWKWIEDRIFPKLKHVIAVNDSIAKLYYEDYGNDIVVIRNVPFRRQEGVGKPKEELGIEPQQKVILYQGAVNIDRGLEEVIMAMKYLRSDAKLIIAGIGDIYHDLQALVKREKVPGKVILTGQIPFQELFAYTLMADIGSIDRKRCQPQLSLLPPK